MTLQPDLPWNVAGIAPEARDAARASARREGLSVAEWLTRRILRGVAETQPTADEWWLKDRALSPAANDCNRNVTDETDHFAHLSRPGVESERRYRRFAEPMNGGASETRHALGETVQVKPEGRERDAGLDKLTARIAQLDAHIAKLECNAAIEGAKQTEAVKALQARIAGLAAQFARTAARSTAQGTELAKAVEAVAGKVSQSRNRADEQHKASNERFSSFAENVASISEKLEESRTENAGHVRQVEERVTVMEVTVETVARDGEAAVRLNGSIDSLTQRFDASEAEYLNNVERFENRLTRIESESGDTFIDRRLQSIEQALADMTKLIEKNAREEAGASETIEKPAAVAQAESRDAASNVPPFGTDTAMPILDLPPFPKKPKSSFAPLDSRPTVPLGELRAPAPNSAMDESAKRSVAAEVESFLAAARSARAGNTTAPRNTAFSWVDPAGQKEANEATNTRLILLGGIGLIVLAAIGTGFYLSNDFPQPAAIAQTNPAGHPVVAAMHRPGPARTPQPVTQPVASRVSPVNERIASVATGSRPVETAATPQRHATPTPKHLAPPATAIHRPPAANSTKPLSPLQRLVALAGGGNAKAQEVLGLQYLDGDGIAVNEAEGAKWLERAAARGEAVAANRLGTLYERGHGVVVNKAKATRWYAAAAKAGNRKAMHNLAVAYAQGTGVQKDLSLAAQWFQRAANLGLADSQFNLAVLYERGLGVQQSLMEAYKWYAVAAAQGDAESKTRMEAIASQIRADDKATAEKAAATFQPAPLDRAANAPPIAASLVGG